MEIYVFPQLFPTSNIYMCVCVYMYILQGGNVCFAHYCEHPTGLLSVTVSSRMLYLTVIVILINISLYDASYI